jgi:hypothetical protein
MRMALHARWWIFISARNSKAARLNFSWERRSTPFRHRRERQKARSRAIASRSQARPNTRRTRLSPVRNRNRERALTFKRPFVERQIGTRIGAVRLLRATEQACAQHRLPQRTSRLSRNSEDAPTETRDNSAGILRYTALSPILGRAACNFRVRSHLFARHALGKCDASGRARDARRLARGVSP